MNGNTKRTITSNTGNYTRRTRSRLVPHESDIEELERQANGNILTLINDVQILVDRKDPLISVLSSPKLLMRGLKELHDMVEMVDIKNSIVNQVKFLITNHARKQHISTSVSNQKFDGHMLHSVISSAPGNGKTTVAMILAKIWMALGFVKSAKSDKPDKSDKSDKASTGCQANDPFISNQPSHIQLLDINSKLTQTLHEEQVHYTRRLERLSEITNECYSIVSQIRKDAIQIKENRYSDKKEWDIDWQNFLSSIRTLRYRIYDINRLADTRSDPPVTFVSTQSRQSQDILPSSVHTNTPEPEEIDPYENIDPKFIVAAREDLIAEFLGQTAIKTKKVLESARGGVLFIDEAYSLCTNDRGSKDKYGEECLTTINEFMSLYPDEIIIIFAGYKDKLMNSIFTVQPGLLRRCAWFFEIKDYTPQGLSKIFKLQLLKNSWSLDPDIDIVKLISDNKDIIRDGGGGTEKLAFFSKLEYSTSKFNQTVHHSPSDPPVHDSIITKSMLESALLQLARSIDTSMPDASDFPDTMYN